MSEVTPDTGARELASSARDRVRFEEEALELADQVYRVARRLVSTREEAEDLNQPMLAATSATVADALAATQRPIAAAAFGEKSGAPAWRRLPSWAVVATDDKAAGADIVRTMAERAGAEIVEIQGSPLSHVGATWIWAPHAASA